MSRSLTSDDAALAYLRSQQSATGAWPGQASADQMSFRQPRAQPTAFFTSLICYALRDVAGSQPLCAQACQFLLSEQRQWAWNYWLRDSPNASEQPYPDDLDDTACALAALYSHDPALVSAVSLARLAQNLVKQEQAPGGPYRTWLVDSSAPAVWQDYDLAVNANIGLVLAQQGVRLTGLETYCRQAILTDRVTSLYYQGAVPVLYFLARSYQGVASSQLREQVRQALEHARDPLRLAMLISSACQLGDAGPVVRAAAVKLTASRGRNDHWPAVSLYAEPPIDGQAYYAGSAALTTALALEALTAVRRASPGTTEAALAPRPKTVPHRALRSWPVAEIILRQRYQAALRATAHNDSGGQIINAAGLVATACDQTVAATIIKHLNLASTHGWLAYTIYDDALDNDKPATATADLSLANLALRRSLRHFRVALALPAWHDLVESVFDTIDSANTWEVNRARLVWQSDQLTVNRLPSYAQYRQLADKSWGHSLAARGCLLALGYDLDSSAQRQLQRFFHHYLIARQLNDDAHDWLEDLEAGRISAVVALLLKGYAPSLPLTIHRDQLADLQTYFWTDTILVVAKRIKRHTARARTALMTTSVVVAPDELLSWLDNLDASANRAVERRQAAGEFITTFAQPATA